MNPELRSQHPAVRPEPPGGHATGQLAPDSPSLVQSNLRSTWVHAVDSGA